MYMLSLNELINIINQSKYQRGKLLFENNQVKNVHSYGNRAKFFVDDKVLNNVEIEMVNFSNNDRAKNVYCSCETFNNEGLCEHIIASILYLKSNDLEKLKDIENKEVLKKKTFQNETVLAYINHLNRNEMSTYENIKLCYHCDFNNGADMSVSIDYLGMHTIEDLTGFYSFLVGSEQTYQVSDSFTYNKNKHYLENGDLRNLKILQMLPQLTMNNHQDLRNISPELLIKVLKQMNNPYITVNINNKEFKNIKVITDDDIKIELGFKKDQMTMTCHQIKDAKVFKYGNLEIRFNEEILGVFEQNIDLLRVFRNTGHVFVDKIDGQKLIDSLFVNRYRKNLVIDESLKEHVSYKDFDAEIFLLKSGQDIHSKINLKEKKQGSLFTIVDPEIRKNRLFFAKNQLKAFGFVEAAGHFELVSKDKIFNFFKHGIKTLEEQGNINVYYTQKLKKYYKKLTNVSIKVTESSIDLLSLKLQSDKFSKAEMIEILKGIKSNQKYIRLNGEEFIDLDSDSFEALNKILNQIGQDKIEDNDFEVNRYQGIELLSSIDDNSINLIDQKGYSDILKRLKNYKNQEFSVDCLQETLRSYQLEGVQWLKTLEHCQLSGILADEMGLGKTIQVIALLGYIKEQSLIVVPSSLMYNWKKEFEKFTPDTKVLIISGTKDQRDELIKTKDDYDIIITSYPLIRRDLEYYTQDEFNYCILDEGQYIKNPDTKTAQYVKKIKSKHRLVLTGTPIENNLMELWSIFDFILPGYLKTKKEFKKEFIRYEERNHEKLVRLINPFILRRKKNDVLSELPEKIENVVYSKMNKKQSRIYDSYLLDMKQRLKELKDHHLLEKSHIEVLSILTRLRQICCDPGLFIDDYDEKSGKLKILEELIEELIEGEHKILIFSQFTSMLKIIADLLEKKGLDYAYLDGQIKVSNREHVINEFTQGKKNIFLISLKAGGTGLNLTEADTVIHVDPWWNPAVEDQATDRAHRIGQKDVVNVYKIITRNSIEENIYQIQLKKRELIESVIENKEIATTFSPQDLYNVLNEYI